MKSFSYVVQDPVGIHARPAGNLVKAIKALDSEVTLKANGKAASGKKLMAVMGLGVKQGQEVGVVVEGGNEDASLAAMEAFFKENL
jgi:phosphocarrier protein